MLTIEDPRMFVCPKCKKAAVFVRSISNEGFPLRTCGNCNRTMPVQELGLKLIAKNYHIAEASRMTQNEF